MFRRRRRKTDVRAKPGRARDPAPDGFVSWSHTLPVFVQGDSSRLGEIRRNPTKGSRGAAVAKKAIDEAEVGAGPGVGLRATPVPDQPVAPPEPRVEGSSPPRPVKRLKLTMRSAEEVGRSPEGRPRAREQSGGEEASGANASGPEARASPSKMEGLARLEVDTTLSGDVVDDKGVLRSFAAAPPTGTNFRNEIKWGRIQG